MRVLMIKTSSLGDIIHSFPAINEASHALAGIQFDWVVEEGFAEIPRWHPAVRNVIPVAIRRWRSHPIKAWRSGEWGDFKHLVGDEPYDAVIDAQGLFKSAWLTRYVNGPVHGFDAASARESVAAKFYQHGVAVPTGQHAVERVRQLLAAVLGYRVSEGKGSAGLDRDRLEMPPRSAPYVMFCHGTTWDNKHWPEAYWKTLAQRMRQEGFRVVIPWGNDIEHERAKRIASVAVGADVLPRMGLNAIGGWLAHAAGVVAVDTGFAHLSAALDVPTVSLYGPTDPGLSGAYGHFQRHLRSGFGCAPCMERQCSYKGDALAAGILPPCYLELDPGRVASALLEEIAARG
jgi:heptosyltransferase-1